jgi:hypothetical protein
MNDKITLKEMLKENLVLIAIIVVIFCVSIGMAVFKSMQKKDINDYAKIKEQNFDINKKIDTDKVYKTNEYQIVHISDYTLVNSYFLRYNRMTLTNPEKAWNMLSKEGKEAFNLDYDKYLAFLKDKKTILTYGATVKQFKKEGNIITLMDTENYKYKFTTHGVWDFEVEFIKLV